MTGAPRLMACRVALVGLALYCGACGPNVESRRPPSVVLFVVDTLRADSLGCYGNETVETPLVDAVAKEGVVFRAAYASSSWTRASMASMLTGLYPETHGVEGRESVLSAGLVTLPEYFAQNGYATAAVITNPNVGSFFGFGQGFDSFDEMYKRRDAGAVVSAELITPSDVAVARALEWIDQAAEPFFLLVLTIDPHWPYDPPAEFDRYGGDYQGPLDRHGGRTNLVQLAAPERDRVRSFYYGEIAFNDASFGTMIEHLRGAGTLDDTVVAFTSDHGEEFWEHGGRWHGTKLFQEAIHVPLIIRYPPAFRGGATVDETVELVDLVPTLLELARIPIPPDLDGHSLVSNEPRGTAYATLDLDGNEQKIFIEDDWKLIFDEPTRSWGLFDLTEASFETTERSREHPDRARKLYARLLEHSAASAAKQLRLLPDGLDSAVTEADLPTDVEQALRALGYIDDEN